MVVSSPLEEKNRRKGNCQSLVGIIFPCRYVSYLLGKKSPKRKKPFLVGIVLPKPFCRIPKPLRDSL